MYKVTAYNNNFNDLQFPFGFCSAAQEVQDKVLEELIQSDNWIDGTTLEHHYDFTKKSTTYFYRFTNTGDVDKDIAWEHEIEQTFFKYTK